MDPTDALPLGEIARALAAAGLAQRVGADAVSPLSGLTNRVFLVALSGGSVVVRLPRPETAGLIDRRRELHNAREAERIGIAAEILHADPASGVMITKLVAGARALVPASLDRDTLEHIPSKRGRFDDKNMPQQIDPGAISYHESGSAFVESALVRIGAAFARLHRSGAAFEGLLDPFALISQAAERLPDIGSVWRGLVADILRLRNNEVTLGKKLAPCHCDPVPGNILERRPESHEGIENTPPGTFFGASGIFLVDWEYSAMADPAWDLAYFALESEVGRDALTSLLEGYGGDAGISQRVARMKPVCDCLSGLWALEQSHAGNAATDFTVYAEKRLNRALREMAALKG